MVTGMPGGHHVSWACLSAPAVVRCSGAMDPLLIRKSMLETTVLEWSTADGSERVVLRAAPSSVGRVGELTSEDGCILNSTPDAPFVVSVGLPGLTAAGAADFFFRRECLHVPNT